MRAFLLPLALACACAQPSGDVPRPADSTPAASRPTMPPTAVEVRLDKSSYPSRADVKLTLVNNARRTLGYNACTRQVERESGGGWTVVPEPDRVCTMELRILDANETVTEQTDLPQLQPGRYRIALNFSDEASGSGGPIRATSSPFDVR